MLQVTSDFICIEEPLKGGINGAGLFVLADREPVLKCRVYGIGPGEVDDKGKPRDSIPVQPGDIVHIPKEVLASAPSAKDNGRTYLFVKPIQILAWEAV